MGDEPEDHYPEPPSRTDVLAPTRVIGGKYRLGRLLGEGGMGTVYEGEHTGLGSRVAVKLLAEHLTSDKALARFRREARAMAAVRHRNVVTVTDTGTDEDGAPYLVMELLDGESLNALLKRERRLEPEAATAIAAQVLNGLAAAHERGIVHRDLKPGNIFLAWVGNERHVKLLDFGISKFSSEASGGAGTELTAEGTMVGTPHYMAPEQAKGSREVDARADLYSVGILLYRMLTGRLPYSKAPTQGLIEEILRGEPEPPRSIRPDIPEELEAVVLRAMSVEPEDRPPDARAMREALLEAVPVAQDGSIPPSVPGTNPSESDRDLPMASTLSARRREPPDEIPHTRAARPSVRPTGESGAASMRDSAVGRSRSGASQSASAAPTPAPVTSTSSRSWLSGGSGGMLLGLALLATVTVFLYLTQEGDGTTQADGASPEMADTGSDTDRSTAVPPTSDEPLRFAVRRYLPREMVEERHSPLAHHLSEALGRPVELVIIEDYQDIVGRLVDGSVDVAALSPAPYARATAREPGLQLLATPVRPGGLTSYEGRIVSRAESDVQRLEDLRGRVFCYVSDESTSGYLYPRALLRREGIDPDDDFRATVFAGDHLRALRHLHEGRCDGAAVYPTALDQADEAGIPKETFRVLGSTDRFPYDAYVARAGLDPKVVQSLRDGLLELEPDDASDVLVPLDLIGFRAPDDSAYDGVRRILAAENGHDGESR